MRAKFNLQDSIAFTPHRTFLSIALPYFMDTETPHSAASTTAMTTSAVSQHTQRHTRLVDLPTEIILHIAKDLDLTDLLSLAVLCRRLHNIALSLYFQWNGVQDLRGDLHVTFNGGYLPGLRIALSLDSAHEIEFVFPDSRHLPGHMREAAHMVSKFAQLESVRLSFVHLTWHRSGKGLGVRKHNHDMTVLAPPIRSLFDAIYAKSCRSFTICHGRFEDSGHSFDLEREMETAGVSNNVFTSLIRKANLHRREPDWSPDFPGLPLTSLYEFGFESTLLLWKPFLNWTLQTFKSSCTSLVKLSFRHLSLTAKDWAHLLPLISLPSLSELAVATDYLNLSDLVLFLRRHPLLTTLCLCHGRLCVGHENQKPLPAGLISGLTKLCGTSDYMLHFLRNGKQFPHLIDVDIQAFNGTTDPLECLAKQHEALVLVAQLDKRIELTISLFWEILYPPSGTPSLAVSESDPPRTLSNVRNLNLRVDPDLQIAQDPALLGRWLSLFPALREVTLMYDGVPPPFDEAGKRALIQPIVAARPTMGYVEVDKDRRSAENWQES
jgi:hypothetical protein